MKSPDFRLIDYQVTKCKRLTVRLTAALLVFLFSFSQISSAAEWQQIQPGQYQPVEEYSEMQKVPGSLEDPKGPGPLGNSLQDSAGFLADTLTLSTAEAEKEENALSFPQKRESMDPPVKPEDDLTPNNYDYERYEFEDALDQLRPEYASAVIVKALTAENLKALTNLSFEAAVIVLHGEIVLFTSGSEDEIGVLPAAKELLKKASFISHTHPSIYSAEGPSGQDLNEADETEYVITDSAVYAYSAEGLGEKGSYEWYLEQLAKAVKNSAAEKDQVEARKELNEFIAAQDEYNENAEERETFRRGGTLAPTAGLTAANVTTLPGTPTSYKVLTSSANSWINYSSVTGLYTLNYDVAAVNSSGGLGINFDNVNTAAVEGRDLSALTDLVFGLKGPNTSVKVEITDTAGVKDIFTLTGISNTVEQFWRIPTASIAAAVNKLSIRSIQFIVEQANTTSTTRTGALSIRANGTNVNAPAAPAVTSIPAYTNLSSVTISGTKPAYTSLYINGVKVVPYDASTTWTATVNLAAEGANSFTLYTAIAISKNSANTVKSIYRDTAAPTTGSININSGAVYAASQTVTLALSSADAGSGIGTMSFSTNGTSFSPPEPYSPSKTFTLPAGDGNKTVYVKFFDRAGNASPVFSKSIILDTLAPTGTLKINNGNPFRDLTVNLNLTASDAGSGIDKMSFSTNNATWTTAEAFAATKSWTFPAGDGTKTVYVKFLDKSGKWSSVITATGILDTVPAVISNFKINAGAASTNNRTVTLTIAASDALSGLGQMRFTTDTVNWTWLPWENYATTKTITLPAGDGAKQIFMQIYDKAWNLTSINASILLDTTPPSGWFLVNNGNAFINTRNVPLSMSVTDTGTGLDTMRFSADGGTTWSVWEAYASSKTLTVPAGDGLKSIRWEVKDKIGNVKSFTGTVTLDTVPAAATMKINADAAYTNQAQVTLNITASDALSGLGQMRFTTDTVNWTWTAWENYAAAKTITLPAGEGTKQVHFQIYDKAWNLTSASDSIVLDITPPTGSIVINGGAAQTASKDVTLALTGADSLSGISQMRFSQDNGATWTVWENFAASKTLSLNGANGTKTVLYQVRDKAGNLSASYSKSIVLNLPAIPAVQFTSAAASAAGDYLLKYTVNGVAYQESWHLAPGANTLVVEASASGVPYFFNYQVTNSEALPVLLTAQLSEANSMSFDLDLTQLITTSGQKLSDITGQPKAALLDAKFDTLGKLTDGILKFPDGRALQLIQGKIRQVLDPSGALEIYGAAGELEVIINPDAARSNFSVRLNDFTNRVLSASTAVAGTNYAFYDQPGRLRYGLNNNEKTLYDSGILKQIKTSGGAVYDYTIAAITGGFEARLAAAVDSNAKPTLIRYDSNRRMTYLESSDGGKFEFQNGAVSKVIAASGDTQYSYTNSALGEFVGFQVTRAGVQRTYDDEGKLASILTAQGIKASVENNTITRVDLGGGQYADNLKFDANGNITETKVHNTDGTIGHYVNGVLVDMELPDRSLLIFGTGKARQLKTADGRIYKYVYALDTLGNETSQALRAELISYTSPDGNTVNLTNTSLTDFVLQSQNPLDNFAGGTAAPASSTFIPFLSTANNIIRNLKLDAAGKMIDAEILNSSGDQYFIINGKLDRLVTIQGKVLKFEDNSTPAPAPSPVPLTAAETVFKNQLIEQTLQYFKSGQGIDAVTGLPFDAIKEDGTPMRITQPTAIGFYLQILGAVMDGSYTSSSMTKQDALAAAQKTVASLLTLQTQVGWKGLLPFANIGSPYTRYGNGIGLGDNVNLAQSLASFVGSLENAKAASGLNVTSLANLITQSETFITNQGPGYTSFYDSTSGLFRSSYDAVTGVFKGYNDRLINEFRTGIAYVITRFNLPQKAWDNLIAVVREYQDREFNEVLNAVPFDGGAFQMFWPLMRATQELKPEMKAAAWNFLYSMADYAAQNDLPGFPSASYDPILKDYKGKIGVSELAETRDALDSRTVSVYALASAYSLAPQFVLSWLKEIQTQYPGIMGAYGFYDAMTLPPSNTIGTPTIGKRYYAIDQGSFLLGLINNGGTAFNKYLDMRGYRANFDSLYDRLRLNIAPAEQNLPLSPFNTEALLTVQPPKAPPPGFRLTEISNAQNGKVELDYLLSPQNALSDVRVQYQSENIERSSDLLTYFEHTANQDEMNYLLNAVPTNLFNQNVEQGAVFTPGQGSSVESRIQDSEKGFVKAFDYQVVPNGQPVGYYAKFNNLNLSNVDFLTFSVRRDPGSDVPKSLEVKLEGLGESFIIDSIPTNWTRVTLPLKKPNTNLSRVAILIRDQVTQTQSGRVYLGDISLFSVKNYSASSWETSTGMTKTQIETLAANYLASGAPAPAPQVKTTLTNLTLTAEGEINTAQVKAKNGAMLYIQSGKVSKVVTPDGKTILYKNGNADTVTGPAGNSASFSYVRDFKGDIQEIILAEAGIQRVYDAQGHLDRLIFKGLSGGLSEGILTSLRTRFESVTDLVGDQFGHIKNARISMSDGRILIIENYKLVKTIYLSGTEVSYDGNGYVTSTKSKEGLTEYLYQKDVTGNITRVDVRYVKDSQTITKNLVPFLQEDNRVEEAGILLETPLVNLTEISSNIGSFFTSGRGYVKETRVTDAARNDVLKIDYSIPSNPLVMGVYFRFPTIDLSKYQIMNVALKGTPTAGALPTVTVELKGAGNDRITLNSVTNDWVDTNVPIDNLNSSIYEVTMLINPSQLNSSGTLYLDDISFFNLRKVDAQAWQDQLSFEQSDLEAFANKITQDPIVDPMLHQVDVPSFRELNDFQGLPTVLNFDAAGNIQQFTRGDGTQVTVNGNLPVSARLSNGQVITYQTDAASQRITSSTTTDSQAQTSSTAQYSYDRTRQVTLEDGRKLEYKYEFDAQGQEVTVIKDLQTGETKKFVNGLIRSSEDGGGLITTYSFDDAGGLKESKLSFQGKASLDVTQYERRGDKTFITDQSGITWIYDAAGVLIQHRTEDGHLFQHATSTNETGQLQRLIFLIERTAPDGTTIYYENGEISRIVFANGISFINPQYDENYQLSGAKVLYEDGSEVDYASQYAVKVTNIFGDVTTYQLPAGKIFLEPGTDGKVEFVRIEKDGKTLRYNREGDLVNLIMPDDTLYQYVYEESNGVRTGRMKVYRRELSKVSGMQIPFPISASADSYGAMHVLINGKLADSTSNQVRVLAIDPADGSVDSSASFNMAFAGAGKNMQDFINAMPDGEFVLIMYPQTSSGYSTDSANFMAALESIGGDRTKSYIASKPWMVLGQKGLMKGQAFDGFKSYEFNGGTIRLDTEKRDVYYLNAGKQVISAAAYGFPSTLLDTSRHGNYIGEMTEVYGTITKGTTQYASSYFKNFNIKYPESGFYRFLPDFEDRGFIEKSSVYLDEQLSGLVNFSNGFKEKAIYYDERYAVRGISINQLRALKGYLVSKGFRVVNADQLKVWISEKGPDSLVLMAQDIAPNTIVDISAAGTQLPRQYVDRGGSMAWLYDIPFYEIGKPDKSTQLWGSAGDNYGLRSIFGISLAYETTTSQPVSLYNAAPSVPLDSAVMSQTLRLNFNIQELDAWQSIRTKFEQSIPESDTDVASIFDQNGVVLGVRKGDGTQNVFKNGKLEHIMDRKGVHLIDYSYNAAGELIAVDYLQARQELAKQIQNAELQVAQLKTKALMQVAANRAIGTTDVQNQIIAARASLADSRSQVEAQRYVTQCSKCGCSQCCDQVENPGYQQAIANIVAAEQQVEIDAANALSGMDTEVAKAAQTINADQTASIAKIRAKRDEVLRSIIQNEIMPILQQFFRLLLGRDPSSAETKTWLDAAVIDTKNRINVTTLKTQLTNSTERTQRLAEINLIKADVQAFLNGYVNATPEVRVSQAASLGLLGDEIVALDAAQVAKIMAFLNGQNPHFGYSAFLPLQAFLTQNSLNASPRTIAGKAILIDILIGSLNAFSEGDLRITLFALERTAKVLGAAPKGAKLTFEELRQIFLNNPTVKLVVHLKGNHYVTLVSVTDEKVAYIESSMGGGQVPGYSAQGEIIEISKDQFLEIWLNPQVDAGGGMGVALLPQQVQIQPERVLDSQIAKLIKGAFCGWDDFLIAVIITAVISGTVQAFTATGGNFVTNFLKGFAFGAITTAVTFGIGTVLGSFATAVSNVAGNILNGIKTFVTPIINGFKTLVAPITGFVSKIGSTIGQYLGGVSNWIGKGITTVKSFASNVMKIATDGFQSLKNYYQTAAGIKKFVLGAMMGTAVDYIANKGLTALGVSPKVASFASAFITGGFMGALNSGADVVQGIRVDRNGLPLDLGASIVVSGPSSGFTDSFVLGGLRGLVYKTIPLAAQTFNFTAEVGNVLKIAANSLLGAGAVTGDVLKGLAKNLTAELAITGAGAIGARIGMDSRITPLLGVPIRSTVTGLVDALLNSNGGGGPGLFKEITKVVFGGAVTLGAAFGLQQIKAPEIVKGLGSVLISGIIAGLVPRQTLPSLYADQPIQGSSTARIGILAGIQDAFGRALRDLFGNPRNNILDFAALAQQKGLKGALDMMIGMSLQQGSLESLFQSTTNVADFALQKYNQGTAITYNGRPAREVKLLTGTTKITLVFDQATNNLVRLEENGRLLEGDIRFDNSGNLYVNSGSEYLADASGAIRHTVYESGKIVLHQDIRENEAFDYYAAPGRDLIFAADGALYEGIIENTSTGVRYLMKNGKMVEAVQKVNYPTIEFSSALFNQESSSLGEIRTVINDKGEILSTKVDMSMGGVPVVSEQEINKFTITGVASQISSKIAAFQGTAGALADHIDQTLNETREAVFKINGSPNYNGSSAMILIATEFLKGYADILRTTGNIPAIQAALKTAAQNGEFETALSNITESFKNGMRLGINPLLAMSPFDSRTPNLSQAALLAGQEGLRILEIYGNAHVMAELAHLGGTRIKSVLQSVRNGFSQNVDELLSSIRVKVGNEYGVIRLSTGQKLEKMGLDEAAQAFKNNKLSADEIRLFRKTPTAAEVNAEYLRKNPTHYKPWANDFIEEFVTHQREEFVRVFVPKFPGDNNPAVWIVRKNTILGKSSREIKNILSLSQEPSHIVSVDLPPGVKLRRGTAAGIEPFNTTGGGEQYEILDEVLDENWFKEVKAIGERYSG